MARMCWTKSRYCLKRWLAVVVWNVIFLAPGKLFPRRAKAKRFLRDVGYTGTEKHLGYDADVIKKTLDNDCPVFIGALASSNHGHAWVIDGYLNYENIIKTYNGPTTLLKTNHSE